MPQKQPPAKYATALPAETWCSYPVGFEVEKLLEGAWVGAPEGPELALDIVLKNFPIEKFNKQIILNKSISS